MVTADAIASKLSSRLRTADAAVPQCSLICSLSQIVQSFIHKDYNRKRNYLLKNNFSR